MEHKDASDVIAGLHSAVDYLDRKIQGTWLSRVFTETLYLKRWAPPHVSRTIEIDEPFRYARAFVVHIPPFRRGIAFGIWSKEGLKEDEALLRAVRFKPPTYKELRFWDVDHARDVLFRNGVRSRVQRGQYGLRDGATRNAGDS